MHEPPDEQSKRMHPISIPSLLRVAGTKVATELPLELVFTQCDKHSGVRTF